MSSEESENHTFNAGEPSSEGSPENSSASDNQDIPVESADAIDAELADIINGASESSDGELAELTRERDSYLEASRRVQAEFENYRKQVAKRETDSRARANESLVSELLPILDACDAALANGAEQVQPISSALFGALEKQGLEKLEPANAPFDPEQHEAVMQSDEETDEAGPVVSEVLRAGYVWKGRVIRPAMVQVKG